MGRPKSHLYIIIIILAFGLTTSNFNSILIFGVLEI